MAILKSLSSTVLLGVVTLAAFRRARLKPSPNNRFSWITALALGLLVKKLLLGGRKSKLIRDASKVGIDEEEYDYVIVGGGTAGCVLAARLSEDPSVKALIFTRIPAAFSLLFHSEHVWQFYTEPQAGANGRKKFWPRGKMLGGCSSINAQMAQFGAPGDFDRWGEIIGDNAWKWENFQNYFKKFERYVPHPDYPDVDLSLKGKAGPMRIGYFSDVSQTSKDFIKACNGVGIPYSPDFNTSKGPLGVNKIMTYIDETRTRVSSESAYFTKEVLSRSNLKVVVNATVTKILTKKDGDEIKAVGVEFAKNKDGPRYRVKSKRDVILSAGAVHSPQILLLSGIGPAAELNKHNIPIVHDLPGVGDNLVDHPVVDVYFRNKNRTAKFVKPQNPLDAIKLVGSLLRYYFAQRGAMATNFGESAAFLRSDDPKLFSESEFPSKLNDTTSGPDSPDLEIFSTPFAYKEHGDFSFPMDTFAIHTVLLRPKSKGTLRLKSTDPWDSPSMDPNYLSEREDVQKLVRGLRLIFKIARQEPLASHLVHTDTNSLLDHLLHLKSDEELEDVVRERVETLYHPTSTCRMAPLSKGGVVDSHLRVYGVKGLRVCDASVYSEIVSGHTAAAALATAEHLADIIKKENVSV
ncbi:hypothetical protein EST38_g2576 [Candolleomyces aberdarensis]|uniref:pyranose dehydrogenase (acceptor) n=1 Tax=Candolleomyces aberdarensis TaxID=2316362 RepID=A0A4Q2DVN7_9AGAR|nr:hypothetical protein EST38_g2576 [Candolleomyces aberdarensis]